MNQNMQEVIAKLAEKFGTSAENIWPALVNYEMMCAITTMAACLILLVPALLGLKWSIKKAQEPKKSYYDENFGLIVLSIILSIVSLILICCVFGSIPAIVNPEAAVIHGLLHSMRGR